jgi:DNA modification methylase
MNGKEVKAMFFKQGTGGSVHNWELKGHAVKNFWEWMAGWAIAVRSPSDIGFDDGRFILPSLNVQNIELVQQIGGDGFLFPMPANGLNEQRANRRATLDQRVTDIVKLVESEPDESWLIWCELNDESAAVKKAIDAIEVKGSDSIEHKERALLGFATGDVKRLVTKPKIAGFGMNWQNCARVIFFGVDHSFESYYQAVRRVWRFGQERDVMCYRIVADTDGPILANIQRKEKQANQMMDQIITHMRGIQMDQKPERTQYQTDTVAGDNWTMYHGDCVDQMANIKDESVGLSIFSPPFPGMYVYTDSERDMGNSKTFADLMDHFKYLIPEILRATMPGRHCAIHLTQGVAFKWSDGYIGIKDFRGKVIESMESAGWIYYGEVAIDKNPQIKAIRTKDRGLLFKSLSKDSAMLHMALCDYVLQFVKPGENPQPIKAGISDKYNPGGGWVSADEWIRWARPVWYADDWAPNGDGIRETDVLQAKPAKCQEDEKHLCPLQLGVIERAVKLWSAPGDLVLSPFAGIGSEGYEALRHKRRFVGIELKRSYFDVAVKNLQSAMVAQDDLLAFIDAS